MGEVTKRIFPVFFLFFKKIPHLNLQIYKKDIYVYSEGLQNCRCTSDSNVCFAYNSLLCLWAVWSLKTNLERERKSFTKKEEKVTLRTGMRGIAQHGIEFLFSVLLRMLKMVLS